MEEEDTLILNEEDGDVLGLAGGIVKAIVGGPEQSRCLPVHYGEMLGRKWVLGKDIVERNGTFKNHQIYC